MEPTGTAPSHDIPELVPSSSAVIPFEVARPFCLPTLALDAEYGSPRDKAIDAVSTRPREDQPNENQRV